MQKGRKKPYAAADCIVPLIVSVLLASLLVLIDGPPHAMNRVLIELTKEVPLSAGDMERLADDAVFSAVYPYAMSPAGFSSGGSKSAGGTLYRVTAGHSASLRPRLIRGRLLYRQDAGEARILLGDKLAIALFGNTDVVGKSVYMQGAAYVVSGVIRTCRNALEELAYYRHSPAYVLQDAAAPVTATHIEGILKEKSMGALGINRLTRLNAVEGSVYGTADLAQGWGTAAGLARGWISLSLMMVWRRFKRKVLAHNGACLPRIRSIGQRYYMIDTIRRAFPLLMMVFVRYLAVYGSLGLIALFFVRGLSIPTAYIPGKLLFTQLGEAAMKYVDHHNSAVLLRHPMAALVSWHQKWAVAAGGSGFMLLACFLKRRNGCGDIPND